ncbi:hypothetical protein BU23DRAFT_600383 [Bimuria novae-zelandiae CBS 107.79]|uniref:Uncharacterized protein n=1 Tax=Bimuria novae-zelandiae CBS 107.79 TaxID=1447943 RepID=A0A6A5V3Q8_9PLEO|nr:hypothetical protein BU23DRAFT_600383 [Bimuria novae-zelandiae CBS 107.79]
MPEHHTTSRARLARDISETFGWYSTIGADQQKTLTALSYDPTLRLVNISSKYFVTRCQTSFCDFWSVCASDYVYGIGTRSACPSLARATGAQGRGTRNGLPWHLVIFRRKRKSPVLACLLSMGISEPSSTSSTEAESVGPTSTTDPTGTVVPSSFPTQMLAESSVTVTSFTVSTTGFTSTSAVVGLSVSPSAPNNTRASNGPFPSTDSSPGLNLPSRYKPRTEFIVGVSVAGIVGIGAIVLLILILRRLNRKNRIPQIQEENKTPQYTGGVDGLGEGEDRPGVGESLGMVEMEIHELDAQVRRSEVP